MNNITNRINCKLIEILNQQEHKASSKVILLAGKNEYDQMTGLVDIDEEYKLADEKSKINMEVIRVAEDNFLKVVLTY